MTDGIRENRRARTNPPTRKNGRRLASLYGFLAGFLYMQEKLKLCTIISKYNIRRKKWQTAASPRSADKTKAALKEFSLKTSTAKNGVLLLEQGLINAPAAFS